MKKSNIVFIPTPSTGHLVSCVEFAKRLLHLNPTFSVTFLIIRPPGQTSEFENYNSSFSLADSRIRYITLPQAPPPPSIEPRPQNVEYFISAFLESHKALVKNAIINQIISGDGAPLAGLVVDMFCSSMIDVAKDLRVPSYVFYSSGTAALGLMMYLLEHQDRVGSEFRETDPDHNISSYVNPVPSSVIPTFLFDKNGYNTFLNHSKKFTESHGTIVNSLADLESHAFDSFQGHAPPVYTVGPIINVHGQTQQDGSSQKHDKIMGWLDQQPDESVVFLCFGSMGSFTEAQLNQIAIALENSGHRFLWSVRKSPPRDQIGLPTEYESYDEFLPEGFSERTKNTGMICGWVPQVEILGHRAVGAFVSHCGWNSILESAWHGVPMVAWPLYAEQQINAFQIVKELGIGVELRLDYRINGEEESLVVMAEEIEKAVACVMQDSEVRKKMKEARRRSREALMEGGSSVVQFQRLVDAIFQNCA